MSTPFDHPDWLPGSSRLAVDILYDRIETLPDGSEAGLSIPPDVFGNASGIFVNADVNAATPGAGLWVTVYSVVPSPTPLPAPFTALHAGPGYQPLWLPVQHYGAGAQVTLYNRTGGVLETETVVYDYINVAMEDIIQPSTSWAVDALAVSTLATSAPLPVPQSFLYDTVAVLVDASDAIKLHAQWSWLDAQPAPGVHTYDETVATLVAAGQAAVTVPMRGPALSFAVENTSAGDVDVSISWRMSRQGN